MEETKRLNIKDWAEEDRPREKMLLKGINALSDAELLAILISSGNKNETAVELSQRILHQAENNLNILGKQSIKDFMKFSGIGEAKAITIVAALELGRRRKHGEIAIKTNIDNSHDIFEIMHPLLADLRHEETWIILLNNSNHVIKKQQISKGGVNSTIVDVQTIMKEAINASATRMILSHNHPSGNTEPSTEDNTITLKLKKAGEIMDVELLDHIIISETGYYSYKDHDRL